MPARDSARGGRRPPPPPLRTLWAGRLLEPAAGRRRVRVYGAPGRPPVAVATRPASAPPPDAAALAALASALVARLVLDPAAGLAWAEPHPRRPGRFLMLTSAPGRRGRRGLGRLTLATVGRARVERLVGRPLPDRPRRPDSPFPSSLGDLR